MHAWGETQLLLSSRAKHEEFVSVGKGDNLSFGGLETFYGGLDGFLGPANPNLIHTVQSEHCK